MSPMRSVRFLRPQATAILLALMFIFADLSLPQPLDGWSELDDENPVHRAVSSHSVDAAPYLSEATRARSRTESGSNPDSCCGSQ